MTTLQSLQRALDAAYLSAAEMGWSAEGSQAHENARSALFAEQDVVDAVAVDALVCVRFQEPGAEGANKRGAAQSKPQDAAHIPPPACEARSAPAPLDPREPLAVWSPGIPALAIAEALERTAEDEETAGRAAERAGYVQQGSGIGPLILNGIPQKGPLKNCLEGRWLVFKCSNTLCTAIHRVWTGCTRLDCEHCAKLVAAQRGGRVWETCGDLSDAMGVVVLTTPPALRELVTIEKRSAMRRAAWEATAEWLAGEGVEGATGGAVWFHPVGSLYVCPRAQKARLAGEPLDDDDKCARVKQKVRSDGHKDKLRCVHCAQKLVDEDDDVWHPHWNVLFPLVQRIGDKAEKIAHWHDKRGGSLDRLRDCWAKHLALVLGVEAPETVNVKYEYRIGAKKIRHALRYFSRPFPGWSQWVTTVGGNRYGELASRRIARMREAVSNSLGLVVRQGFIMLCECGGELSFDCLTAAESWRWTEHGIAPPERGKSETP